ncbi:Uu.00g122210.m01.CDS01 [Anthostomella pinea]|uniref:Uu.00g122210.m01.CDS01 n=1 Tax=Anthostomella pinea TaxID=933095 RepID=A0AAI8VH65_9PEZI|nr:Uu.00g122210.m01.CDS01 [Anthostomella pinea]
MCHTYIKSYPCGHSALGHRFCDEIELSTPHHEPAPCATVAFTLDVEHPPAPCPITHCAFQAKGRGWVCCVCGVGGNMIGSCAGRDAAGRKCCHVCCGGCRSTVGTVGVEDRDGAEDCAEDGNEDGDGGGEGEGDGDAFADADANETDSEHGEEVVESVCVGGIGVLAGVAAFYFARWVLPMLASHDFARGYWGGLERVGR